MWLLTFFLVSCSPFSVFAHISFSHSFLSPCLSSVLSIEPFSSLRHLATPLSTHSGPVGPHRGPEHLQAAQARQQQSAADRPWHHQLPDICLRRPGAGAQRPGQRAALCRHVSQLAAQRLRHVRMMSGCQSGPGIMDWPPLFYDFLSQILTKSAKCACHHFNPTKSVSSCATKYKINLQSD